MSEKSNIEKYLATKNSAPQVSALMANSVSQIRKDGLANEVSQGLYSEGSVTKKGNDMTVNGLVTASVGIKKSAQVVSSNSLGAGGGGGAGDTVKQTPEVYSPLWLNSNLSLPRDRATINAWCRSFFALNPFVHNAISLHSTYPISKLNIKCYNKEVEKFFNDMIEELDLMNMSVQIAQEFWLLGEAFVYADYDQSKGKWRRLLIQNPDYMVVNRTVASDEPSISLRPDENLRRIVFSNKSRDVEQRKQLNQYIIDCVKRGDNIPMDNFHVSHIARKISPYESRGTGLPVAIFRQLMLFDQLRECYDSETEVLTKDGFKKIQEITIETSNLSVNPNYVNGVVIDSNGLPSSTLTLKDGVEVACFNQETGEMEYHLPVEMHMSQYEGKMYHFTSRNFDIMVTPNHKMWVEQRRRIKGKNIWTEKEKVPACKLDPSKSYRFTGHANWVGNKLETINVLGTEVPTTLYLKFLGYLISEGHLSTIKTSTYIDVVQSIRSDCLLDIQSTFRDFAELFNLNTQERIVKNNPSKFKGNDTWNGRINNKKLVYYFKDQISDDDKSTSAFKKIPLWVKSLDKESLQVLLESLVLGDGSHIKNKNSLAWKYYTISKQLADDVQEIAFKCGYSVSITHREIKSGSTEYCVSWSNAQDGRNPWLNPSKKQISQIDYNGIVWCFEVPTGLFITRRNGKITIQGNSKFAQASNMINPLTLVKIGSADYKPTHADLEAWRSTFESAQYDKDFKIFTHEGVAVERVGYGTGIYDISGDITQLVKEIYSGLQVPSVLMDGGSDTTYANGGVALDVLRQRYMQFRNMMASWLKRKIFAPIAKIQEFYEYKNGEKQLIVPDIDWNHMSLFDTSDYINVLVGLTQGEGEAKRASLHTLYRSLGLDAENEIRNMRKESIQAAIAKKEKVALETLSLNELRSLDDEDEIPEPKEPAGGAGGGGGPVPGEPGGMPSLDMGGGLPGGPPPGGGEAPPSLPTPPA
jgi:hypothetical protein